MPTRILLRETEAPSPRSSIGVNRAGRHQSGFSSTHHGKGIFARRDPHLLGSSITRDEEEGVLPRPILAHALSPTSSLDINSDSSFLRNGRQQQSSQGIEHGRLSLNPRTTRRREQQRSSVPKTPGRSITSSHHRIVSLRSSILRDIPENKSQTNSMDEKKNTTSNRYSDSLANQSRRNSCSSQTYSQPSHQQGPQSSSSADIRASPRLMGYLFQLLACSVMLISVIPFYRGQQNEKFIDLLAAATSAANGDGDGTSSPAANSSLASRIFFDKRLFTSVNGPVYYWKLMGCVAVGSAGVAINLLLLLLHFDTICVPRLWFVLFRDGSKFEFIFLYLMLLFWVGALYVCTSSLSVGEVQPNVYFTTWIAFVAATVNCGVWRVSAGLPSIAEQIILDHYRETTYNWCWSFLFVLIVAGSVTDIYINREDITLRLKGKVLTLSEEAWAKILGIIWGVVGVCITAILFNHYLRQEISFQVCRHKFLLGWRHVEGIVLLGLVVVFFWMIYTQTGADGIVNGLNNGYFGIWGSFFNTVFTLGTWLRENRDIEYIVWDRTDTDNDNDSSRVSAHEGSSNTNTTNNHL